MVLIWVEPDATKTHHEITNPRKAVIMTAKNTSSKKNNPDEPEVDVEQAMAVIEKGQQLAGHFPSAETMARARQVLTRELTPEDARARMCQALERITDEERDDANGS